MAKFIAQWLAFIVFTVGSLTGALAWVFDKNVDKPFELEKPPAAIPTPAPAPPPAPAVSEPPPTLPEQPPLPAPDESEVVLRRCLMGEDGIDKAALFRLAKKNYAEVLTLLTEGIEPEHDAPSVDRHLFAFNVLARMGFAMKSPHRMIELGRGGHLIALDAASRIGDARAVRLFVELLRQEPKTHEERTLRTRVAFFARHFHSPAVGQELNGLARAGSLTAVESLAFIGSGADRLALARLARSNKNPALKMWASRALEAERILSSSRVQDRLLDAVRKAPAPGPLYSWPDWALDKIVALRLEGAVEPLRQLCDGAAAAPHAAPEAGRFHSSESRFRLRLLRAIQRLGGPLSEAEILDLETNPLAE